MIFGFGKSSTRVMPSVASGKYSPGPDMAMPSVTRLSNGPRTWKMAQNASLSQPQNPHFLLQCPQKPRIALAVLTVKQYRPAP
jgi:hypothetical protein